MKLYLLAVLAASLAYPAFAGSIPIVDMKDTVYAPRPVYPFDARRRNLQGSGMFIIRVRPNGTVARVEIEDSTGAPLLDQVAVAAFSKWRFKPGKVTAVRVPMHFTMRGAPYTPQYHPPRSP